MIFGLTGTYKLCCQFFKKQKIHIFLAEEELDSKINDL